ncbi:hypothetical protein FB45DRAFT_754645 [Roridomyces roridus]|uniref:NADH:flavin oxidoreductase/NADH oxidase N-terminal domain-containing protein n=1 Tax=Roridomyces roridus TaxID=1738132 RepID=A0AAD7BGD4_9AGAR|nr:hypothetical protein FB45DRAFT_754645 [Roridomyces roridus]
MASTTRLFQPMQVGPLQLKHRIVLAPLTRCRAGNPGHVPHNPLMKEYYTQRASTPGTLLITEATHIAPRASGVPHIPGIWSEEQIAAWKQITDSVHDAGSYIFLQVWAMGRAADPNGLRMEDPSLPYVSASNVNLGRIQEAPRPLTVAEIQEYVELFRQAAKNAVRAGFDGTSGANGYLIDQFTQDVTNRRSDDYGGSVQNRVRFAMKVIGAVANAIGANRTAIRISPCSTFNEMRMVDPVPTFAHLVSEIKTLYPDLAYLHLIEPRVSGDDDATEMQPPDSNDFLREIWGPNKIISAGGYTRESAIVRAEANANEAICFGRAFLANPDLPLRLLKDLPLNKADRATFYKFESVDGYTDYPSNSPR